MTTTRSSIIWLPLSVLLCCSAWCFALATMVDPQDYVLNNALAGMLAAGSILIVSVKWRTWDWGKLVGAVVFAGSVVQVVFVVRYFILRARVRGHVPIPFRLRRKGLPVHVPVRRPTAVYP